MLCVLACFVVPSSALVFRSVLGVVLQVVLVVSKLSPYRLLSRPRHPPPLPPCWPHHHEKVQVTVVRFSVVFMATVCKKKVRKLQMTEQSCKRKQHTSPLPTVRANARHWSCTKREGIQNKKTRREDKKKLKQNKKTKNLTSCCVKLKDCLR